MTPTQLRVFLTVADALSLRAAAKRLNVSQPAVTKSIRELERQLSVELIVRHAQGITLTECGQVFRRHATSMIEEMRRTREDLLAIAQGMESRIAIAVSSAMSLTVLPTALKMLQEVSPLTKVHVMDAAMPHALDLLRDGSADLLLVHTVADWVGVEFNSIRFLSSDIVACASRHSPHARAVSLADTLGAQWIYPKNSSNSFDTFFTEQGVDPPRRIVRSQSFTAALSLMLNGDSIAFIIDATVDPILKPLGIVRLELAEKFSKATGMAITRSDIAPTRAVQLFLTCLHQIASSHT